MGLVTFRILSWWKPTTKAIRGRAGLAGLARSFELASFDEQHDVSGIHALTDLLGKIMSMWNFLSGLISPVAELVDALHTSDEERLQIKAKLFDMQNVMASRVMEYEARLLEAKTRVVTAEAQGASWLQRNWRPITMLTFLVLVVADTFGLTEFRLADQAWTLLQIGLGGYVVGRSAEKIIPKVTEVMRKD